MLSKSSFCFFIYTCDLGMKVIYKKVNRIINRVQVFEENLSKNGLVHKTDEILIVETAANFISMKLNLLIRNSFS